ncbi:PREDICTED: vesicle transport protein SEC20 isoform X1 [Myotis brandtii]|uniref:vesicle transport protein SEC20 isoform X1 n=1 Tax=Myotis brandtii TaxID=109478 RepID=UPI0003BBD539|nr:PREDICTED: vesicle transport protein SEC20 isoform X1 [Myotis brandtii]
MAAAQDVHVRICNQEIVKFDLEVKALIQDIRDCSGPLSALTELNAKVKEKFQQLRHRIQELEQLAKEQDRESDKQVLLQEVENHKKQMLSNQTSWRKANLTCKIAIDNLEKAELLQGGDLLRQRKTAKENLAQTSSTITENLMGISRVMSQQVQQSEEAMQTLGNAGLEGKLLPGHRHLPRPLRPAPPTLPALPTAPSCFCIVLQSPAGMAPQIRWYHPPLSSMNGSISHASFTLAVHVTARCLLWLFR